MNTPLYNDDLILTPSKTIRTYLPHMNRKRPQTENATESCNTPQKLPSKLLKKP